ARNAWNTGWLTTSVEVTVTTNQPSWNVVSDQSWLSVVRLNNGFRLTASTNTDADRTATVTVTAGVLRETINVTQEGFTLPGGEICPVCNWFDLDEDGNCPNGCIIHIR
ncbi:MAG: BACON domain-containing protein, partial [Oscillospiraceae bacterium]|nr:BACON domain-containing protein [Oscillospiraceae bacterium]